MVVIMFIARALVANKILVGGRPEYKNGLPFFGFGQDLGLGLGLVKYSLRL